VNLKLGAPCLNPGLVEELEVSPVVQLPDNCARRESCPTSDGRTGPVLAHPGRIDDQRPGGAASTRSSQGPSPTCPATRPPAVRARCPTEARIGSAQTNRAGTRVVKRCWARALAVPPAPRQTTSPSDSGQIWSATRPTETGSRAQPRSPSGVRLMALTSSQARASGSSPARGFARLGRARLCGW